VTAERNAADAHSTSARHAWLIWLLVAFAVGMTTWMWSHFPVVAIVYAAAALALGIIAIRMPGRALVANQLFLGFVQTPCMLFCLEQKISPIIYLLCVAMYFLAGGVIRMFFKRQVVTL